MDYVADLELIVKCAIEAGKPLEFPILLREKVTFDTNSPFRFEF